MSNALKLKYGDFALRALGSKAWDVKRWDKPESPSLAEWRRTSPMANATILKPFSSYVVESKS